jgi:lipoprotein-anchoring transpeptidase ErfK/SrfK
MGRTPGEPLIPAPSDSSASTDQASGKVAGGTEGSSRTQRPTNFSAPSAAPETNAPLPSTGGSLIGSKDTTLVTDAQRLMQDATRAQSAGNLLEARTLLNRALLDDRIPGNERGAIRAQLGSINDMLIFSPTVNAGDPLCGTYTIASGDSLVKIRDKQSLPIDWRLLQRINRINPSALKIGQKIKTVRMPFHAVVRKSEYRMDLYIGEPLATGAATTAATGPDGQDPSWTFVRSFNVGLGEGDGTPVGVFTVRPKSKLINPHWVNPRTGEKFGAEDPRNPIGEHWIGLEGLDASSSKFTGYGIHGTIDDASIGQQKSMGCVRMHAPDIALVYELLTDRLSVVRIVR